MPLLRLLTLPGFQVGSFVAEGWAALRGDSRYADVPPLEPSLRVVGEAVVDRTFTLGMNLLTGLPGPAMVRRSYEEAVEMRDFLGTRGWLSDPDAYHRQPPPVEGSTSERRSSWQGRHRVAYDHVVFESGFEPYPREPGRERWLAFEGNRNQHAYVLEHRGAPRPWLVCVHGFGMGLPITDFTAFDALRLHHDLGLNVVFPCLPLHGPRAAARLSGSDILSPDYLKLVHLFAQAVWDIRRTLTWVRGRGGERVGLYGISLGGYNSALVAAFEPELACVIAGLPPVDFANVARDNEPWIMRRYDEEFKVDWELVRAIMHVVSPLALAPRVPRERRFIYAGIADRVVRPDQARALWRHWDRSEIHWFSGGHVTAQWNPSIQPFIESCLQTADLI